MSYSVIGGTNWGGMGTASSTIYGGHSFGPGYIDRHSSPVEVEFIFKALKQRIAELEAEICNLKAKK